MSVRAARNQAARRVLGMIEARQKSPAASQRVDLAIVQNDTGQVRAQKFPQLLAGFDGRHSEGVRRPVGGQKMELLAIYQGDAASILRMDNLNKSCQWATVQRYTSGPLARSPLSLIGIRRLAY